jgi:hypothetical protein
LAENRSLEEVVEETEVEEVVVTGQKIIISEDISQEDGRMKCLKLNVQSVRRHVHYRFDRLMINLYFVVTALLRKALIMTEVKDHREKIGVTVTNTIRRLVTNVHHDMTDLKLT